MARGLWRGPARVAAAIVGGVLPVLTVGMVHADLPGLPPLPPLPFANQPITLVVEPPSVTQVPAAVDPEGCAADLSYDNTQVSPLGSIYRGQGVCGSGIYAPILRGQATLSDVFGNQVSAAAAFAARGNGPYTSQGDDLAQAPGTVPPSVSGGGAVPGLEYTITFDFNITLVWPQYWASVPQGCVVRGETVLCTATTTYSYIPGTKGGFVAE